MIALLLVFQSLIAGVSLIQVAPTWITSNLVKAGQAHLITNLTLAPSTPISVTITFSSAFAAAPNVAYGIINYEGNDFMGQQFFEVYRSGLTTTSLTLSVKTTGFTNLWLFSSRYMAIDKSFPHHLNCFDDVPVNYSNGQLINLSEYQSGPNYYINTINYTKQAAASGYRYRTFRPPYSNFKILLFLTCVYINGNNEYRGQALRPLDMRVTTTILSNSTYKLNVTSKTFVRLYKLQFSMIIYDQASVPSQKYMLVSQRVDFTTSGGFLAFPKEFMANMIMGFVEYSSPRTLACIHFNLKFQNKPGTTTFGGYMPASVPRNGMIPYSRFGFTLFYMKTWVCPVNTFFNVSSDLCVSCPIANCVTCTKIDLCATCNTTAGYVLDPTAIPSKQCTLSCPIPYCLNCSNSTSCSSCDISKNYFLVTINKQGKCVLCSIPNCLTCDTTTKCKICDEANNYFMNPAPTGTQDICVGCAIPYCLSCLTLTYCDICDESSNYFRSLDSTQEVSTCTICDLAWCLKCQSLSVCAVCDLNSGYILNSLTGQCVLCSIPNCVECSTATECAVCDIQNNYLKNTDPSSTTQCVPCPIPNCLYCTNFTACQTCNRQTGYFLNPNSTSISDVCIQCSIPNCSLCEDLTLCFACNMTINYFFNPAWTSVLDQCTPCAIPNCVQCASHTSCLVCNWSANYFVDVAATNSTAVADLCIICGLPDCIQCMTLDSCYICNETAGFFLNTTDLQCSPCDLPNCLQCKTLTTCLVCNTTQIFYYASPVTGQCEIPPPLCGDNIFMEPEMCDDGNLVDGDGCSATCTTEVNFTCQPNPFIGTSNSVCYYIGEVTLTVVYIEKIDNANQVEILLDLFPAKMSFWDNVDFAAMVGLSSMDGVDSYTVTRNSDGTVSILINYNKDIHNVDITVQLDPTKSGNLALSRLPTTQKSFPMIPTDNEAALFYEQDTYNTASSITIFSHAIAGCSLLFFLVAIFARKLVGVEMMAVVQISFLSLLTLPSMNPNFEALSTIWFVNGFNYFSLSPKAHLRDIHSPLQVKGVSLYSRFTENYNFTFLLICVPYLASLVSFILSKTAFREDQKKQSKAIKLAKVFACESAFNGIMFSGYIIAVSFALEIIYGTKNMAGFIGVFSVIQCCILLLLYAIYFFLIMKFPKHFGEFVYCFRKKRPAKTEEQPGLCTLISWKWYNLLMAERILVGGCLVFLLSFELEPLVTILVFLLLGLYCVLRRPYFKTMHNVRFGCNMLVCIAIQAIYLGYKKASFHDQNKSSLWLTMSLVVCILLLLCIAYNIAILIYELVMKHRTSQDKAQLKQEQQFINFQLLKQRTTNANIKLNSIAATNPTDGETLPGSPSSRKGLKQIRNQIKNDLGRKQSLLNKSKEVKKLEEYQNKLYDMDDEEHQEQVDQTQRNLGEVLDSPLSPEVVPLKNPQVQQVSVSFSQSSGFQFAANKPNLQRDEAQPQLGNTIFANPFDSI